VVGNDGAASEMSGQDRCPGRMRHWRIVPRTIGIRAPVCIYCGSPNPRPLSEGEWATLIDWANHYNVGAHVRAAIEHRAPATTTGNDGRT
jgi:hypothetical protein